MDRDRLQAYLDQGLSQREIAQAVGVSRSTVSYWIGRHGLSLPRAVRRAQVEQALREGRSHVIRTCRRHGETEFALVGSERRPRCKLCRAEAVARRRRKVKELLIEEAGGRCQLCGYDECIASLEFHHVDPKTKSFGVAQNGITRSIERVRAEVKKCVLLCANCHAAVEVGFKKLPVKLGPIADPN